MSLPACVSQTLVKTTDTSQTPRDNAENTTQLNPTPEPFLIFEVGKYIRDEYCSRVFDYQKTRSGELSIFIADNLIEKADHEELKAL